MPRLKPGRVRADGWGVLLALLALFAVATVPLAGGRLSRLLDVRLRGLPLVIGALVVQVVVISLVPDAPDDVLTALHLLTYVVALGFIAMNLRLRGMWVVGLGGLLNFVAIAANGGVMPASRSALRDAGRTVEAGRFENSAAVRDAKLSFLGDVFAMPASWPLANVFSVGDVLIAVGVGIVVHQACGSRLTAAGRAQRRTVPQT